MTKSDIANGYRKVTHCIFDMDGLLLDTERLYTQATQSILDEYGKTYTWDVKAALMGFQRQEVSQIIVDTYQLPMSYDEYGRRQHEITMILMREANLMPDTEPIYEEITRQIAGAFGIKYPFEVRMKMLGTSEQRSAEIAVTDLKLPITIDEYMQRYHKLCRELLSRSELLKGAERLLRHLHANNIPIALATSSGEDMVQVKITKHHELFDLFNHRVCGSTDPEVKEGKPAPDVFLVAAQRFADNPNPADCLVFEDAPNGVKAANAAGMQAIIVPDPNTPAHMYTLATKALKSLQDFQPEEFGLPPFPDNDK